MSYKIGDKVKILNKDCLPDDKEDIFPYFVDEMLKYCGKDGVIASHHYNEDEEMDLYQVVFEFEDNKINGYEFSEWMFDGNMKNKTEQIKEQEKGIKINLSDFDALESLLDYVKDKYGEYFDKKIARKKFLDFQPTEEEIEVLQMLNSLDAILFYDNHDSFVLVNGETFKMKMFERFEEIMDYLNFTNNVELPISFLLGDDE